MARASGTAIIGGTAMAMMAAIALNTGAEAAQGPGIAPGTASALVQTTMAIAVYAVAAAIVLAAMVLKVTRRR